MPLSARDVSASLLAAFVFLAFGGPHAAAQTGLIRCYEGESAGDDFGAFLVRAGDVDGDGFEDLLVGASDTPIDSTAPPRPPSSPRARETSARPKASPPTSFS